MHNHNCFTIIILFLRLDRNMYQPSLLIYKLMTYKQKSQSLANWFAWAKVVLKKKMP